MRISCDPDDIGFDLKLAAKRRVLLNGEPVSWITADDVVGEAKVGLFAADGSPQINPATGAQWFAWKTGRVEILSLQ